MLTPKMCQNVYTLLIHYLNLSKSKIRDPNFEHQPGLASTWLAKCSMSLPYPTQSSWLPFRGLVPQQINSRKKREFITFIYCHILFSSENFKNVNLNGTNEWVFHFSITVLQLQLFSHKPSAGSSPRPHTFWCTHYTTLLAPAQQHQQFSASFHFCSKVFHFLPISL